MQMELALLEPHVQMQMESILLQEYLKQMTDIEYTLAMMELTTLKQRPQELQEEIQMQMK